MASFPDSIFSPASKNTGDTIQASHVSDLDSEVVAIEQGLRNGTAPLNSSLSTLAGLVVNGTLAVNDQPGCSVFSTAATVVSTTVFYPFGFESQDFSRAALHSTGGSTNNDQVLISSSGTYLIIGRAYKQSGGSTSGNLYLRVNASNKVGHHYSNSLAQSFQLVTTQRLQVNDVVQFGVVANDTTATTFGDGSSAFGKRLEVVKLY